MYLKKDQLLPLYNIAKEKSHKCNFPKVFLFTQKINLKNNIISLIKLDQNELKKKSYWNQISKKNQFLSFGEVLSLNTNEIEKPILNSNIEKVIKNANHINKTTQKDIPIFIGGQNFNLNQGNSNIWKGFNRAAYRIPKILIIKNDNLTSITFFIVINKTTSFSNIYSEYSNYYNIIKNYRNNKINMTIKLQSRELRTSKNEFVKKVLEVKKIIQQGNISKVVLSNICKYSFEKDISYYHLLKSLEKQYPECTVFYYDYDGIFLGASPEQVLKNVHGKLMIDALAG